MNLIELFKYNPGEKIIDEDDAIFHQLKSGLFRQDIASRILKGTKDFLYIDTSFLKPDLNPNSRRIIIRREDGSNGPAFVIQRTGDSVRVILHDMRKDSSIGAYRGVERRNDDN